MPLIRVSFDGHEARADRPLGIALSALPEGAPVTVLIHGYKFAPGDARHCPHRHILSLNPDPRPRAVSWPRHLGFGRDGAREGLCLAFGWNARGSLRAAHRRAAEAGSALADMLARAGVGRAGLVAHSLGARVALSAMARMPEGTAGRTILMAAAATRIEADAALASPGGRHAEILNVRSGENTVFDLLYRAALAPPSRTLGAGLGRHDPRWLDLSIDCPETLAVLRGAGYRVAPPSRPVCHWSGYLRPGLFPLYRAWLGGGALPVRRTVSSAMVNAQAVDLFPKLPGGVTPA